MTPAHIRYLHEVARQLDAAPAVGGERGRIVARAAETLGKSAKTVYALLRRHAGWCSGRKARADSGVTCVDRELALTVGGLVHVGRRQNGKKTTSIKAARELLQANGLGVPDESTGEIVMPSVATLSRAMRAQGCHPDQLRRAAPASDLRSLHPNHTWELDASVCVLYRMKGSRAVRLLNERDYNEHKPGKLLEVAGQRIIRYVVADHYSGALYVRYEQARGEDALGVIKTLIAAMEDRGPRDPLHGVPFQLFTDPGSGNRSGLLLQFLERLDIRPLHHAAGNARATGAVEVAQNIVETGFESRLRFMTVPSLEELQARADAWRRHFNATAIHRRTRKTRNAVWGSIRSEQLRVATRPVMEAIAAWQDKRCKVDAHFRISVDTRACGVHEYDLRELGYHGLCVGDSVVVRLNPFLAPVIRVICRKADGTELVFEVSPVARDAAGFDITAPVIGEDYRSAPRTVQQQALDDVLATAYGTDSAEAARRHKQRDRTPFAHLDPMADVREAPLQFRRPGTPVAVEAPQAAPLPLNHAQAAMRLRAMCGEAWSRDPAACMALVRQRFPRQVPEDSLEELAALINGRDSARHGATVLRFDAAARTEGERACAN